MFFFFWNSMGKIMILVFIIIHPVLHRENFLPMILIGGGLMASFYFRFQLARKLIIKLRFLLDLLHLRPLK